MIRNGKVFRNLQEQVLYLTEVLNTISQLLVVGVRVVGEADQVSDIPAGEYQYGDAYLVGTEDPKTLYIWTRANGTHPEDYWARVGQFPMPGPQGEQGIGVNDVEGIVIAGYSDIHEEIVGEQSEVIGYIAQGGIAWLADGEQYESDFAAVFPFVPGQYINFTVEGTDRKKIVISLDDTYVANSLQKVNFNTTGYPIHYGVSPTNVQGMFKSALEVDNNKNIKQIPPSSESTFANTSDGQRTAIFGTRNKGWIGSSEGLICGGNNNAYGQDFFLFGYRCTQEANQNITGGYRCLNKASESVQIGNQLTMDGTITLDDDGDPKSNSKYNAQFGQSSSMGTNTTNCFMAGQGHSQDHSAKWNTVLGKGHSIGHHNECVNVLGYENTTHNYITDSTIAGYSNEAFGGSSSSSKYDIYMFGHENTNRDGNKVVHSNVYLLGKGLRPKEDDQTIVGNYNAGTDHCWFEVGCGTSGNARSTAFAVCQTGATKSIKIGNTELTESQLQALLALI